MVPIMLDRRQAIQVLTFGTGGLLAGVCWPGNRGVAAEDPEAPHTDAAMSSFADAIRSCTVT